MPPFRDYLDKHYTGTGNHWKGVAPLRIMEYFQTFFHTRKAVTPALRAVGGTPHAATFNTACGTAFSTAKGACKLATTELMFELAVTNFVTAIDIALGAAEAQGGLALLVPPVPVSAPGTRTGEFNPTTGGNFVRIGMWVVRAVQNNLVATEIGTSKTTVAHDYDVESLKTFISTTRSMVSDTLGTLRSRATTVLEILPDVDNYRHAEDTWFRDHLAALLDLLDDTANIVRLEILVTVTMCSRCRDHYMKYVRQLFGTVPIFIYTFRDDVMPNKTGPTQSTDARKQSVWEVLENADIKYRGTWTNLGTTADTFNYRY